jgi:hypothetical protein
VYGICVVRFIKSGHANTAALTIGFNNSIAIGKKIANEVLDISGSLIATVCVKCHTQTD